MGSHSFRKFAWMHVRCCGISKDDKDTRGRWDGKGHDSDRCDDVELPYPDCKVAEKLCMGGACYYVIDNSLSDSNILKKLVLTKVVPNDANDFRNQQQSYLVRLCCGLFIRVLRAISFLQRIAIV